MRPPLRAIIAQHGLDARRSLGQHFLLDGNLAARIVRTAGDLAGRHVIEIGPGPGGLTRALLDSPAVAISVIEIDPRAVTVMRELQQTDSRLSVIYGDALKIDLTTVARLPCHIVANLPYNIASPLLVRMLRCASSFERMTLMFQREVANRICAPPGTAAYGRLSVLAQWTCAVEIALRLSPSAFVPPPKVWSAVVSLTPHARQPDAGAFSRMEKLTAAAFGRRRKMLRGALRSLGGDALLRSAGIAPERRAETLAVAEFERLLPP